MTDPVSSAAMSDAQGVFDRLFGPTADVTLDVQQAEAALWCLLRRRVAVHRGYFRDLYFYNRL